MPPRRSTRSRASVEPVEPQIKRESVVSKRKRSQVIEVEDTSLEEQEEVKPAIRTRRASSAKSLDQQPSLEENESMEERPAKSTPKRGKRRTKAAVTVSDNDDDDGLPVVEKRKPLPSTPSPTKARLFAPTIDEDETSLLDLPNLSPTKPSAPPIPEAPKGPKARLVIHKMALVNFKSYAGRQEIGPFHKSFSAIVGPNGSGKSNTIDALLFVFGYRASKMRQGKLSELIHNSAQYPDLDDCSVEVHFREIIDLPGKDAFTIVPGSTLVVARTAYKNNSSKYTINGQMSNYKEVQTLLKSRGIDLDHNRFLILQGEVESIAQMKPKAPSEHEDGLLEYLEDIIGTSQYKLPIEESLAAMERLVEERAEKLNRLRLVEKEKSALEAKKREAEDFLRLQNEHVRAQSRLWQWYLWKCLVNEEEFANRMTRIEKELTQEEEQNKDDVEHLAMLEKHYKERILAYEEVKAAAAEAVKDLAVHEKQAVGLEEKRKHATGKAKKLKKSLHEDERLRSEALRAIDDNAKRMEIEKEKVEELEASLEKEEKVLESIRDSLKDKTQGFHDQIEQKQKELQPWTAKINTKQAEINIKTSERDMLAKKLEAIKDAGKEAQENLQTLQDAQKAKTNELEELKAQKAGLQQEMRAAEQRSREMQARVQELRSKASASRQRVDEARSNQAANTSQNRVLDGLTRLRTSGRITGFHGRLGSLGTIPDKYDVAISTACGALNNMVVDTVEQGQACIEYLRKQNVGRASFMVLEKLSQTSGMERIQTPENVPRLFDLIKPKESRFAAAFYKGVSNTLVADNLEQANRIAFGGQRRWRVVTLAGQLIDSSGTMSGGGTHVARGGMSSKLAADAVSPDVLRTYEQDSEAAAQQLEQATQELRQLEAEHDSLVKSGPQIDISLQKLNLDIQNGARRITEAEKRVRDLRAQSKPDAGDIARITALEKEIHAASSELERLQERSGEIEDAIKALEKKILDIGGARMLGQKSKVDGIKLHINLANDEITKAEVAKAKAEKDSSKLKLAVEAHETNLQEVEAELEDLHQQLKEVTDYVAKVQQSVEEAQAAAENSKDDLDNLKAELDEKNQEIQGFRKKQMELQQKLGDVKKEALENDRALEHWRTEHDKLQLEDIDDDDEGDEEEDADGNDKEGTPEPAQPASNGVKEEPIEHGVGKKKARSHTPPNELHIYSAEELGRFRKQELIGDEQLLDEKLKNAKPNLGVLKEYRKREEEFLRRAKELEDTTNLRDAEKAKYDSLGKQRLDEFMAGFNTISLKLKEMYQMITLGGNAELELVDSMDPFSEGIIFSVMPPKKSWRNISNLSGGEKTLSSLALVFALHVFKPTPLYFMDEIDAALDFRNVSIVANYIKDRTKDAQFIIISLRNDMFELSHRLIGIYKTSNQTQSISIDNRSIHSAPTNRVSTSSAISAMQ
ncbi:hypothetical protein HETIRDRAFT_58645 [Heterobasidion irregulare TC 32-1]|uniref:Structural maintenance of chromosomes protein n=1 Tax=Heterobasidion irregulare (strain TC 32-1) TaxID=747525 RepID=W4KNP1_HETIT|nr:uncharacterized protein HETIRDRAFT_58645 [Heterobasidion irregulare TC 32-1]ETW86671.1 hypothetical protein HETIRDRAFT_58645 [Heterobasidion irregulare TC 32-1]